MTATIFDNNYYLSNNEDVRSAVESADFADALEHFKLFGANELRAPNDLFSPLYYLSQNQDVAVALQEGNLPNIFVHYQLFGEVENRPPSQIFEGFNAQTYIGSNPDVAEALNNKVFSSALHHFISFGQFENRSGVGINAATYTLTTSLDNLSGTLGGDTFQATLKTLQAGDTLRGNGGYDKILLKPQEENNQEVTIPLGLNISGIEELSLSKNVHQNVDFSSLSQIKNIKLTDGTTREGNNIRISLAGDQTLHLVGLKDGDPRSASLSSGGGLIVEQNGDTDSIAFYVDGAGRSDSTLSNSLLIDFANQQLGSLNLFVSNENDISIFNSGGNLATLNVTGTGSLRLKDFPSLVENIDASNSSVAMTVDVNGQAQPITIKAGNGDDYFDIGTGDSSIDTSRGNDVVIVRAGANIASQNTIKTGEGADRVEVSAGTNVVFLGAGDDVAVARLGFNTFVAGGGKDRIITFGGTNTISSDSDDNNITINGGSNSITLGTGNDSIYITGGQNGIETGLGDDTIIVVDSSSGTNITNLDAGAGNDSLSIYSNGTVTLPSVRNIENFFLSDTVHQSLDFSFSSSLNGIELDSGTTIDGATITTTLGQGQSLTLTALQMVIRQRH